MTSRGCWDQISEIKFLRSKFGLNKLSQAQNYVFRHFLYFGSTVFLEIAYNSSLQQYITAIRGKTHRKYFGDQILVKIRSKIRYFAIFSSLVHLFSFKLHVMIVRNNVELLVEVKPAKKVWGQIWAKSLPKLVFFFHFFKLGS